MRRRVKGDYMKSFRIVEFFKEVVHATLFFELVIHSPQGFLAIVDMAKVVLPVLLNNGEAASLLLGVLVTAVHFTVRHPRSARDDFPEAPPLKEVPPASKMQKDVGNGKLASAKKFGHKGGRAKRG
jgi:hypothetical protein